MWCPYRVLRRLLRRWGRRGYGCGSRLTWHNPQRDERTLSGMENSTREINAFVTRVKPRDANRLRPYFRRRSWGRVPIGSAATSALDQIPLFMYFGFVAIQRSSLQRH